MVVRAATVLPYAEAHDEKGDMGADMDDSDAEGIGADGPVGPSVEGEGIRVVRPGSEDGETPQGVLGVGAVSRETVGAGGIFMARHRVPPGRHSDLHSHATLGTRPPPKSLTPSATHSPSLLVYGSGPGRMDADPVLSAPSRRCSSLLIRHRHALPTSGSSTTATKDIPALRSTALEAFVSAKVWATIASTLASAWAKA